MDTMNEIPVVFSTDHGYIKPTVVAIHSLLECSTDCKIHLFIILDDDVTDDDKGVLCGAANKFNASIDLLFPEKVFSNVFETRGITRAAYFRLLIPWMFPQYPKIIYCDGDIVFCQSVSSLYNIDVADNSFAGVHTPFYDCGYFCNYCKENNINQGNYINSGILLINTDFVKKIITKEKIISKLEHKYLYQDQDIINILFSDTIKLIPIKYNFPSYIHPVIDEAPVVVHYSGPKPWKVFTHRWPLWWSKYRNTAIYNAEEEYNFCNSIIYPDYSLKSLAKLLGRYIKRHIIKK